MAKDDDPAHGRWRDVLIIQALFKPAQNELSNGLMAAGVQDPFAEFAKWTLRAFAE